MTIPLQPTASQPDITMIMGVTDWGPPHERDAQAKQFTEPRRVNDFGN